MTQKMNKLLPQDQAGDRQLILKNRQCSANMSVIAEKLLALVCARTSALSSFSTRKRDPGMCLT